jgi:catechol 2,3-dioxygenase-like lactoylglutathione lyase family enzyme
VKRFHVHVAVDDLEANIRFYSGMFGAEPTLRKPDYAKWMMEDPRVNFAISQRGAKAGVDHLGFQVDTDEELTRMREQVAAAEIAARDQPDATCCYARSDKYWITDPQVSPGKLTAPWARPKYSAQTPRQPATLLRAAHLGHSRRSTSRPPNPTPKNAAREGLRATLA